MELPLSNNRRLNVEEFDSGKMLAHAAQQAKDRGYKNFPIVDVDSHHYELESFNEILEYMPDPVLRQLAQAANAGITPTPLELPALADCASCRITGSGMYSRISLNDSSS